MKLDDPTDVVLTPDLPVVHINFNHSNKVFHQNRYRQYQNGL